MANFFNEIRQRRQHEHTERSMISIRLSQPTKEYYQRLGVTTDASFGDIRKAYRSLALICHPDKTDDPEAQRKFYLLSEAYEVLRDPQKRANYDRESPENSQIYSLAQQARMDDALMTMQLLQCIYNDFLGIYNDFLTDFITADHVSDLFFGVNGTVILSDHSGIYLLASTDIDLTIVDSSYVSGFNLFSYLDGINSPAVALMSMLFVSDLAQGIQASLIPIPHSPITMPKNSELHERFEEAGFTDDDIPRDKAHLICPLSGQIFTDPVDNTKLALPPVERAWIETQIRQNGGKNPYNPSVLLKIADLKSRDDLREEAENFVNEMIERKRSASPH